MESHVSACLSISMWMRMRMALWSHEWDDESGWVSEWMVVYDCWSHFHWLAIANDRTHFNNCIQHPSGRKEGIQKSAASKCMLILFLLLRVFFSQSTLCIRCKWLSERVCLCICVCMWVCVCLFDSSFSLFELRFVPQLQWQNCLYPVLGKTVSSDEIRGNQSITKNWLNDSHPERARAREVKWPRNKGHQSLEVQAVKPGIGFWFCSFTFQFCLPIIGEYEWKKRIASCPSFLSIQMHQVISWCVSFHSSARAELLESIQEQQSDFVTAIALQFTQDCITRYHAMVKLFI